MDRHVPSFINVWTKQSELRLCGNGKYRVRQRKNETREKRAQRKKKRKGPSKKNEEKMS
jgi:hypothetical protein